jgi:hypothetical protein
MKLNVFVLSMVFAEAAHEKRTKTPTNFLVTVEGILSIKTPK